MTSPLVTSYQQHIRLPRYSEAELRFVAELACYLGTCWENSKKRERLRTELRRDFGDCHSVRVSVLIM